MYFLETLTQVKQSILNNTYNKKFFEDDRTYAIFSTEVYDDNNSAAFLYNLNKINFRIPLGWEF